MNWKPLNKCIKELVEKRQKAGLHAVTDGEFRRSYWHLDVLGLWRHQAHATRTWLLFHDEETRADSAQVEGKIRFNGTHPDLEAFKYLKSLTDGTDLTPRQSIPAPAQFYAELYRGEENIQALEKFYSNKQALIADIDQAYHDLILALYDAGCRDLGLMTVPGAW